MKFKYFLFFCLVFILSSLYIIIFERQRPVIVGLVTETHKQIDSLKSFKQDLQEASEKLLNVDKKYLYNLGFIKNANLYSKFATHNFSLPAIVTYVKSGQEEQAVSFARNIASLLPTHLTVMYNIDFQTYELFLDALRNFGAIFFMECDLRLLTSDIYQLTYRAEKTGIIVWKSKYPTTTITHPKMFEYFKATREKFNFVPAMKSSRMLIYNTAEVHENIMYPWVKCALVRNCILPIGAQNSGCQFNKRPKYRYSGCHHNDISALSIVLGLAFNYTDEIYSVVDDGAMFRQISAEDAKFEISLLVENSTNRYFRPSKWTF